MKISELFKVGTRRHRHGRRERPGRVSSRRSPQTALVSRCSTSTPGACRRNRTPASGRIRCARQGCRRHRPSGARLRLRRGGRALRASRRRVRECRHRFRSRLPRRMVRNGPRPSGRGRTQELLRRTVEPDHQRQPQRCICHCARGRTAHEAAQERAHHRTTSVAALRVEPRGRRSLHGCQGRMSSPGAQRRDGACDAQHHGERHRARAVRHQHRGRTPEESRAAKGFCPGGADAPRRLSGRHPRFALFLSSPASAYVTGQQIAIDGGYALGSAD